MIGTELAHYRITAKLGEGGMGEVWRATDGKLGREVAIKVLPESFAADPERLTRFEREAKLLASLNHPHIAAIYGLEQVDGRSALILELVEGPTLAERLAQGQMPLDEALEEAHEKGIVHRELKPANVKLDAGVPEALFPLTLGTGESVRKVVIAPDKRHFLAEVPATSGTAAPTRVVVGWDAALPP